MSRTGGSVNTLLLCFHQPRLTFKLTFRMHEKRNHVYLLQRDEFHHKRNLTQNERKHDSGHSRDYLENLFCLVMRSVTLYLNTVSLFSLKTTVRLHKTRVSQQLEHFFLNYFRRETYSFLVKLRSNTHLE